MRPMRLPFSILRIAVAGTSYRASDTFFDLSFFFLCDPRLTHPGVAACPELDRSAQLHSPYRFFASRLLGGFVRTTPKTILSEKRRENAQIDDRGRFGLPERAKRRNTDLS